MVMHDTFCSLLEMSERILAFYNEALEVCDDARMKELFMRIQRSKHQHHARISDIVSAAVGDKNILQECVAHFPETDSLPIFSEVEEQFSGNKVCSSGAWKMLGDALAFELEAVQFYEKLLETSPEQKQPFFSRLLQEARGQYVLLSDLQYFLDGAPTRGSKE